jgi:hypothetical protein
MARHSIVNPPATAAASFDKRPDRGGVPEVPITWMNRVICAAWRFLSIVRLPEGHDDEEARRDCSSTNGAK